MHPAAKIVTVADAARTVRAAQARGETVVMCHGCFDLVHPGHVRHLRSARTQGDRLLVTVTGDELLGKGVGRPLIPQELRAENLAELEGVDWVAINDQPTATELLERIQPDVYVKGREYEHNCDPRFESEKAVVERHGGRVVFTSGDVVFSSTALITALEREASPIHAAVQGLAERHGAGAGAALERFRGRSVVVIGDVVRDTYVHCARPEVGGEGPMMTLRPVERREYDGGAAVIARHIAAMGGSPVLVTGLPRSVEAESMRRRLAADGVDVRWIETTGQIAEKQRFLVGRSKVFKLDLVAPTALESRRRDRLVSIATEAAGGADAAVIADFGLGLLADSTVGRLCAALRPQVTHLLGDVSGRRSSLLAMRELDLVCPAESEAREALGAFDDGLSSVVWRLLEETGTRAAMIKLGEEGLIAFQQRDIQDPDPEAIRSAATDPSPGGDGRWRSRLSATHVPALTGTPVDTLGCGDALLAAAALTLSAEGSVDEAGLLGAVAASAAAQRLGNAVVGMTDLRRGLDRLSAATLAMRAEADEMTGIAV